MLRFIAAALLIIATFAAATSITILNFFSDFAGALGHRAELTGVKQQLQGVSVGAPETMLIIGSDRRYGEGRPRPLRHDDPAAPRPEPQRDLAALDPARPQGPHPRLRHRQVQRRLHLRRAEADAEGGQGQLTGLKVNHIVNVDFTGFVYAINAIGCVYVDVDRRYYHSNAGLPPSLQYSEINIQPGYQKLCGKDALEYVRYRHTDNDIVRAARQQDFLREARQKVPATDLLTKNRDLIHIFTHYTSSDISDAGTALQVMKLLIEARDEPIKEVHFPATVGANVTVTPQARWSRP